MIIMIMIMKPPGFGFFEPCFQLPYLGNVAQIV